MHEEDDGEEDHGQAAANPGDDGEVFQIKIWDGFVDRSLEKNNQKKVSVNFLSVDVAN